MQKTILLTGATDGIGFETAKMLVSEGHHVLVHGRNPSKLEETVKKLSALSGSASVEPVIADLSRMADVKAMAERIAAEHSHLDVLINNAGIFRTSDVETEDGLDIRFAVNTIAPYLLTLELLGLFGPGGRVVNVSSAAQAPVNLDALAGRTKLADMDAYSQSKLAIIMWSRQLAHALKDKGVVFVAVNPGSLLGSKMVKEGFGVAGGDIRIGAQILTNAALDDAFAAASGEYFDNDSGQFAPPHADGLHPGKCENLVQAIEQVLTGLS